MEFLKKLLDPELEMQTILILLALKVLFACIRAIKAREFDLRFLPEFVVEDVLPYGVGLSVLYFFGQVNDVANGMFHTSAAAVALMLGRQVWDHLGAVFSAKQPEA